MSANIKTSEELTGGHWWQMASHDGDLWFESPDGFDGDEDPGDDVPAKRRRVFVDGHRAIVDITRSGITGSIVVVDPKTNRVLKRLIFVSWSPRSITSTTSGVWVAGFNGDAEVLARFDDRINRFIQVPGVENAVLYSGLGSLWATNAKGLTRLNPTNGRKEAFVAAGPVQALAFDEPSIWVTTQDAVVRIDARTNRIVARIQMSEPGAIAADGDSVVVVGSRDPVLFRIDAARNKVRDSVDLSDPVLGSLVPTGVVLANNSAWVGYDKLVRVDLAG